MRKTGFRKLSNDKKQRLFKFIAHLAILAGEEMSPEGYAQYNEVVSEFLMVNGLMDDFVANARKANLPPGPVFGGSC